MNASAIDSLPSEQPDRTRRGTAQTSGVHARQVSSCGSLRVHHTHTQKGSIQIRICGYFRLLTLEVAGQVEDSPNFRGASVARFQLRKP